MKQPERLSIQATIRIVSENGFEAFGQRTLETIQQVPTEGGVDHLAWFAAESVKNRLIDWDTKRCPECGKAR